ncbi:LysR family transcriptional regulator [uncultured Cohaesibacter sp.]|uniref:LysR family transcriptional regulator n=1 Tax=uncultured Cohaesibacter sp. TaxID=1002546 RepID=UPI0029C85691|nr:LysR family transcriptional regulator [uncultured Cohaesibacter sp.]
MSLSSARLKAVNAVLEQGSFSAAARALGMTQPAISQSIHKLEEHYGIRLFETQGRQLVPTDFCLELTQITYQIEKLENEALVMLRRGDKTHASSIRIGLGNTMPGMALIGKFKKQFPYVQVDVSFGNFNEIIDNVIEDIVDVGILPNLPKDGRFFGQVCLKQKVVAIVQPSHALAAQKKISLRDLLHAPVIFRSSGSSTQKVVDRALRQLNLAIKPQFVLETRDGVCEAVANGLGIGFIWNHGTSRNDGIVQLDVLELDQFYDEVVFCSLERKSKTIDAFFSSVTSGGIDTV